MRSLVVFVGFLLMVGGCKNVQKGGVRSELSWVWSSIAFDVEIFVECPCLEEGSRERVAARLSKRTEEVERLFSLYISDSSLSLLNKRGVLNDAPNEFIELIDQCVGIGDQTSSLFDVTVQPLWEYYYNRVSEGKGEEEVLLGGVLEKVDYRNIITDMGVRSVGFKRDGMKITLNGIVQGYLTDQLIEVLKEEGVTSALVNAGEYRALGRDGSGELWGVGIVSGKLDRSIDVVELKDGEALAVSSGAGYTFDIGGKSHHLFHPQNVFQSPSDRVIVVMADTAAVADALATSFAVCKEAEWNSFIERLNVSSVLSVRIYDEGKLRWERSIGGE